MRQEMTWRRSSEVKTVGSEERSVLPRDRVSPRIDRSLGRPLHFRTVTKAKEPITIDGIKRAYADRQDQIRARIAEFDDVWKCGTDTDLWEEMVFCFFTGG